MKERNLLYFITALVASILLLLSILVRTQPWFNINDYGQIAVPTIHYLIIPVILIWVGWYFEDKGFLLASAILFSVIFALHLDNSGLLNNNPYLVSRYAPAIKTAFVLSVVLTFASAGLAYFTYIKESLKPKN